MCPFRMPMSVQRVAVQTPKNKYTFLFLNNMTTIHSVEWFQTQYGIFHLILGADIRSTESLDYISCAGVLEKLRQDCVVRQIGQLHIGAYSTHIICTMILRKS